MGAVTRGEIEEFWTHVKATLEKCPPFEWTSAEPSIYSPTLIHIREGIIGHYPWEAYQEVLHEVAHDASDGHGQDFHSRYATLINQFLGNQFQGIT